MNSVASPAHSPVGANGKGARPLAVTDTISVDTSGSLVDTPPNQQDSGSNQSGSDSGLGYSNTISENFLNPKAAKNVLGTAGAEPPSSASLPKDDNNNRSNNNTPNNPQNRITNTVSNSSQKSSHCQQHINSESVCSTSGSNNNNKPALLEAKTAKALANFPSQATKPSSPCESSSRLPNFNCGTRETGIVTQHNNNGRTFSSERSKNLHHPNHHQTQHHNELVPPPYSPSSALANPINEAAAAPVLKSLLKKPASSGSRDKLFKHSRNVSFNQTVIVFCEEIVTSSSPPNAANAVNDPSYTSADEQLESQPPPLPPQLTDYQDHHFTLSEPAHDQYCDAKNSTIQLDNIGMERAIGESANNLDDKRLFSLLEDQSLMESFHSHHDECDDLSDDDFPGNGLNYLSIDALSDYDSDSESSSNVDGKDCNDFDASGPSKPNTSLKSGNYHQSNKTFENGTRILNKENKNASLIKTGTPLLVEHRHQHAKIANLKLMPARMKVTPVDASLYENQNTRKDSDFNSRPQSKTVANDRFPANVSQKPSTYATSKNLERSLVDPKPSTKSAASQSEQHYSNVQELNDPSSVRVLNTSNSLPRKKLVNQVQKPGDYRPAIPLHQPDVSYIKTAQRSECCQICQLIESQKSNTHDGNVASRSQPTIRDDAAISVPNTLQKNAQLDQADNFYGSLPLPNRPTVLSQSCVSCRELSMKQATPQTTGPNIIGTQQMTPVACQLVYLVDQKGNRIKALSVVRPNPQNASANSNQPYRQLYFPTSAVLNPQSTRGSNGQFIKIDGTQPGNNSTMIANSNNQSQPSVNQIQNQQVKLVNPRKQLVYYIRQPLESQAPRHTTNPGDHTTRTFPDAHEIRRLDGVKGPTFVTNLVNKEFATCSTNYSNNAAGSFRLTPEAFADDPDDPTFGFSQRPSVKVVANFTKPHQDFGNPQAMFHDVRSGSVFSSESSKQNFTEGRNAHILNSQTLDRRSLHQSATREVIPSTSSMGNIKGALLTPQTPSQYLSNEDELLMNDNESKLPIVNKVQHSNNVVAQTTLTQGIHQHDDLSHNYPESGSLKAQKTNGVLYSMNI